MPTPALKGNEFLLKLSPTFNGTTYTTVAAMSATSLTFNKATVDITNKGSAGWSEMLPGGGVKSAAISASGFYTDDASQNILIAAFSADTHWAGQVSDAGGNTFTGTWNIDSLAFTGDANDAEKFEISLSSSGPVVIVTTP